LRQSGKYHRCPHTSTLAASQKQPLKRVLFAQPHPTPPQTFYARGKTFDSEFGADFAPASVFTLAGMFITEGHGNGHGPDECHLAISSNERETLRWLQLTICPTMYISKGGREGQWLLQTFARRDVWQVRSQQRFLFVYSRAGLLSAVIGYGGYLIAAFTPGVWPLKHSRVGCEGLD
jgi:hypothetical protein